MTDRDPPDSDRTVPLDKPAGPGAAPLSPGGNLGPYRILRLLGKGGMGEALGMTETRPAVERRLGVEE